MSAYMVFTREETTDADELATYMSQVSSTFAGHQPKLLAAYGAHEDVEGPPTEGTVIVEFASREAAMAWYNSPEYATVRQHRFKGANYRAVLVEGV